MSEDGGGEGRSFQERLDAARRRQRSQAEPSVRTAPAVGSALAVGVRVGVELVSALVVAVAIGWALDRWLHTRPLFLIVFTLLGGAAGIANVWRVMLPPRAKP